MKKRITGFLMCAMMLCMSLLAGCSLVETNYKNYYTQTVAVVEIDGKSYEISKRDLLYAYQTSGVQYVQYYGMSKSEVYKQMLTTLENTKILVSVAEKKYGLDRTKIGDESGFNEKERTYLYTEVENAFLENFKLFLEEESESASSSSDEAVTFDGYTKNATYDSINKTIIRSNKPEKLLSTFSYTYARDFNKQEDKNLIYSNFISSLDSNEKKIACHDFFRNLKANEYGLGLSTDQKSVFMREIERLYNAVYESYVCSKYNEDILDENSTNVTPEKIAELYASKVRAGYTQYVIEQDSTYDSTISSSLDKMYYFKEGSEDNKYFTVANILIKFDKDQQTKYNNYTEDYKAGKYDDPTYQSYINGLYNELLPVVRTYDEDSKEYVGGKNQDVSVQEVYGRIIGCLEAAQLTKRDDIIGDEINRLIYMYNEDPGMFNATNNYVIGVDKDNKLVSNSFVAEFNNAAIALYDGGNAELGDVSDAVRTSFGIHFLVYTGACENLFNNIDSGFSLSVDGVNVLYTTRVNPLVNKTYFDVMYDEIYKDNSSSYQQANLNMLKQDCQIYEYTSRFSDLF